MGIASPLPTEKALARRLRGWRRIKGMTLREAAKFARVPLATYHRAERGIGHLTADHYRSLVLMLEKDLLAGKTA
jgi:transcriptional regulator with XRE-family HTH domain